jgi:predicted DNA-binding transcriptional regulator YafY
MSAPSVSDDPSKKVSKADLDAFVGSGFGIFAGAATQTAHLKFTEHAARWVAEEIWHEEQKSEWREKSYHLHVPYSDERELIMEVLRYGPDVEVLAPESLRREVVARVRRMAEIY